MNFTKMIARCFIASLLLGVGVVYADVWFTKSDLELIKGACLAGNSFEFNTEADGSISVKNIEGKGKLLITKKDVTTVDLPDSDKSKEFHEIRTCIKEYLEKLRNNHENTNRHDAAADTQKIAKICRHEDFGLDGWANDETITESSGWMTRGSNPTNWCNTLIARIVHGRSIGPKHKATVLSSSEEGRWTGFMGREREYNYHCTVQVQWNPIYKEGQDASRCGTI